MGNLFHEVERVASARRDAIAFDCMDGRVVHLCKSVGERTARYCGGADIVRRASGRPRDRAAREEHRRRLAVSRGASRRRDLHAVELRLYRRRDRILRDRRGTVVDRRRTVATRRRCGAGNEGRRQRERSRRLRSSRRRSQRARLFRRVVVARATTTSPRSCTRRARPAVRRAR